jgi:flavin-dependent dehydrogenase
MEAGEPIEAFRGAKLDAAIIGGGPAGAAVALALKRSGIENVAMIDRPRRRRFSIGESAAPGIAVLLERLGLDCRLERLGHRPCHGNASFWGEDGPRVADFFSQASGPGWHLDRAAFDGWLRDQARAAGARLLAPARLLEAERDGQAWRLLLGTDAATIELSARWVLDATGRGAAVSRRLGARLHRVDHLLALAIIGRPADEARFRGFTVIEATEIGWWYGARLPDGRAMMALMTDADIARRSCLRAAAAFHQAWLATIEMRRFAVPVSLAEAPAVFSAATQFLDRAAGPGWLALGDALMALDPLSASGLTGALEDALAAGEVIAGSLSGRASERRLAAGYARRARATLESYLTARLGIYAAERRWRESPFWRRRIAGSEIFGYHLRQQEEFAA